jgi:transcriptional regulator with XRE-family HTH domain
MGKQHDQARRRFHELLAHYHARSGRSCSIVADLSGVSAEYISDLLSGRRWRIRPHMLRMLCEHGWSLSATEGQKLLKLRLEADPCIAACPYLPIEIRWELAGSPSLRKMSQELNIDFSYLSKIVNGKRRPTLALVLQIFHHFGYDTRRAAHLYSVALQSNPNNPAASVAISA